MECSLGNLARKTDGAAAPTVALLLFVLVASAGIAFDYARIASLDTELQNAADQAALAAATQLNKGDGAQTRATAAAESLVGNLTLFGNDGSSDGTGVVIEEVVFYASKEEAVADNGTSCPDTDLTGTAEENDAASRFVCVRTVTRAANFALTPVVGALTGQTSAMAVATIGSAVCKTPPLMMCNPKSNPLPGDKLTDTLAIGTGIRVTGHGNTKACQGKGGQTLPDGTVCEQNVGAWAPGDFGFLEVGTGQNSELIEALAFQYLDFECLTDDGQRVNTGNPQALYDAINTRFDIYDFSGGNGTTLAPCLSGSCPAAPNTRKDLVNTTIGSGNQKCGIAPGGSGNGWKVPDKQYWPNSSSAINIGANPLATTHNAAHYSPAAQPDAMGLPRDLCHYNSYGAACPGSYPNKIGDGKWGRADYFAKNHPGITPPTTITRYQTYLWEQGLYPAFAATPIAPTLPQRATPVCSTGSVLPGIDRRVLTVAVVNNCSALSGSSTLAVIGEYVDMFLVEPIVDGGNARGNGDIKDSIYMELIGPSPSGANGAQVVQRDVPYLVK